MAVGTIRIARERSEWKDRLRSYSVVVDGESVGKLANGDSLEVPVAAGKHTVRVKVDWNGSTEEQFFIQDEETVTFRCRARAWEPGIRSMLGHLLSRDRWVALERQ